MEEYKSNSNKSREAAVTQPEKRVEKVVSGNTRVKKKSGIQKFADIFVPEDVGTLSHTLSPRLSSRPLKRR